MEMVAHHGIATNLDGKDAPASLRAADRESTLYGGYSPARNTQAHATEEGPSHASSDAVINTNLVFNNDLASGVRGHQ